MSKESIPTKHVFLDYGRVLVGLAYERAVAELSEHTPLSESDLKKAYVGSGIYIDYESGRMQEQEFFERQCELLHFSGSLSRLKEIWEAILIPHVDNLSFAEELSKQLPVSIISNTNPTHAATIERFAPIRQFTDHRVYSCETGYMKPQSEIYERALRLANVPANQCLFLDDREDNVASASKHGIRAYVFPKDASLREFWRQHQITSGC